jgi:hypothetical protein
LKETTLHLVLGDHGAGLVRAVHGDVAAVVAVADDLSHGPLADGRARLAYFRRCYDGFAPWTETRDDAFADWDRLDGRIARDAPARIVVWGGANASEATFRAMACRRLAGFAGALAHADAGADAYTGLLGPDALRATASGARDLTAAERAAQARIFDALAASGGTLRRWSGGSLVDAPADFHDPILTARLAADWVPVRRYVADAMARSEPANRLSDLFVFCRLREMIGSGRIVRRDPARALWDDAVRAAHDS